MASQRGVDAMLGVVIAACAMFAGFVFDRIHIENQLQQAHDRVEQLQKDNDTLRQEFYRVRERQRVNEDRIMKLEDRR